MDLNYKKIIDSDSISDNDKYYWGYQYRLGKEILIPYFQKLGYFEEGYSVAEIGSAEGGVIAAFVGMGASGALGTDIQQWRLDKAIEFSSKLGMSIPFVHHDIVNEQPRDEWLNSFDIILLRDVIEHLDNPISALSNIKKMLKPDGVLYVSFPPYWSPYGGHQHTLANLWGKIPFLHYLPLPLFKKTIASGRENDIEEVLRLKQNIRMTPSKFIKSAKEAGFSIIKGNYYLLRPVFKVKFGLPAIRIPNIMLLRNLVLEASYLLKK
jgi:2-polyprenyl-3-methyl-5-hydroxy-6-metoxy-1,4-benzoquinol methylase